MPELDQIPVADELKLSAPLPSTLHPAAVYLASLNPPGSIPTMRHALDAIAPLLTNGEYNALMLELV